MKITFFNDSVELNEFTEVIKNIILDSDSVSETAIHNLFDFFDKDKDGVLSFEESETFNKTIFSRINNLKSALIIVDFQNDFVCGSLAIKNGKANQDPMDALPTINKMITTFPFKQIVYTQDWHPSNHISFYEHCRNSDRELRKEDKVRKLKPFDTVKFNKPSKICQVLYPSHCVQNSWGAEISPHIKISKKGKIIKKGTNVYIDSYSAFGTCSENGKSELEDYLRSEDIDVIFVCGLAYEICVAATAKDSLKLGFLTGLVSDCSKGLTNDGINNVNEQLLSLNAVIVNSDFVEKFVNKTFTKFPWQWILTLVNQNHSMEGWNEEIINLK
ncbi:Isochorismatase-like domain and EF-hand domain and EF-hand domain pair-containing protein [Strongyloides ratti]|uniref:nicotinamidase n=1 Tax=Strongyloides ratti TaxID=34506 RepID=A0A090KQE8_STRRB|nr:Isochorismatase-like domain and EF-hand domain and EF-hand domain pair-containing protein [Strongyloides ratti]CEF59614.1 Isochorismatase-like domain and EF-hand domain and EF-hand domain pair-containing protein [Strongyloides ratti]